MKLDTFIVITKGLAHVMVGIFAPWTGALTQWINSGEWPGKIIWVGVILPLSAIGAGSSWVAFTSGSWREYQQQRKADNSGQDQVTVVKPASDTVHLERAGKSLPSERITTKVN